MCRSISWAESPIFHFRSTWMGKCAWSCLDCRKIVHTTPCPCNHEASTMVLEIPETLLIKSDICNEDLFIKVVAAAIAQLLECQVSDRELTDSRFDSRLAIVVMSLEKTLYAYFLLGRSSLPVVEAQPDETVSNRTKKTVQVDVVRQTQSAWFMCTNKAWKLPTMCKAFPLVC